MGMGGYLMWTAVANNLKKQKGLLLRPESRFFNVKDAKVWINNKKITKTRVKNELVLNFNKYVYNKVKGNRVEFLTNDHIISWTCKKIGLEKHIDLKCELFPTENEIKNTNSILKKLPSKYICIEPHSKTSWMKSRVYPFEKYQNIVNALKSDFNFVQISQPKTRELEGVIPLNGLITFRESYHILKNSLFLLSTEGGLVHMANAAAVKAFVIYTSYQNPSMTMYPGNTLIDIALYRDRILGYKDHDLYKEERDNHDESEIIELIKNEHK